MAANAAIRTELDGFGLMQDGDNVWNAGGAQARGVDAHVYAGWVYDYLNHSRDLNGFDNLGSTMRSIVEATTPFVCPSGLAFWDPTARYVAFCAGEPFSGALDVVGHEWGHALTDHVGAGFIREKEPGALNEAFSDWLGTAIEHANWEFNWTIGEGIRAIRDMANPSRYDQPDTYKEGPFWVDTENCIPPANDFCGIHANSGVPNRMFYLLSVGGAHNGVTVSGIGIHAAILIAVDANDHHWTSTSTFLEARRGMVRAAETLFGVGWPGLVQIENAWDAVKVFEPAPPSP
jgi:Zn-dependent metalloprotease